MPKKFRDLPDLCTVQDIVDINPRLWSGHTVTRMCREGTIKAVQVDRKWVIPLRPFLKQFGLISANKKVRVVKRKETKDEDK